MFFNFYLQWASSRIPLREATVRLMAGASPGKTQQLLNQSLLQKTPSKGLLLCVGKKRRGGDRGDRPILTGEREHATALYLACRHLPAPMLSTPGEQAGMLAEAAKTLERIGDQRGLERCYSLMKKLGGNASNGVVVQAA